MAQTSFLKISGIETAVGCWGRWVEEESPDEVIICFTGNPGIAGFYYPYLEKLHYLSGKPTWVIGHAGHEEPVVTNSTFLNKIGPVAGREAIFNLDGQYYHKLEFIEKYTTSSTKIHLIGHSVGAWIALKMLKDDRVSNRIKSAQFLFPTLQKIAETPNGYWVNNILRRITPIFLMLLWLLTSIVPLFLYQFVVKWFCYFRGIPSILEDTIVKYLYTSSTIVEKILFMAYDEMDKIKDLDIPTIVKNSHKIRIVYNKNDKWAPGHLFQDMPSIIPQNHIREVSYDHAFVLKYSNEMATLSAELIHSI